MTCKHCGARIERGTMYVQMGTDGNPPDGQTVYFADGPSSCEHEPEEPSDPQGWRAMLAYVLAPVTVGRMARITYPTGSCGEYIEE